MEVEFLSYELEKRDEWRKWINEIPFIPFKDGWLVKPIPPFTNAITRFLVKTPKCERVSVYLDCYEKLGCFDGPYWEVYPHEGDVFRCGINEVDELIKAISEAGEKEQKNDSV